MHKLLFTLLFIQSILLVPSAINQKLPWVQRIDKELTNGRLSSDRPYYSTAIVVKSSQYIGDSISVWFDEKQLWLPLDPDAPEFTYFLSYSGRVSEEIVLEDVEENVEVYLINSGETPRKPLLLIGWNPPMNVLFLSVRFLNQNGELDYLNQIIPVAPRMSGM